MNAEVKMFRFSRKQSVKFSSSFLFDLFYLLLSLSLSPNNSLSSRMIHFAPECNLAETAISRNNDNQIRAIHL